MGGILDRYLFRSAGLRLVALTSIIVIILTLENTARLAADVERSNTPFRLLGRLSLALIPEHLSAALPVALMLATALTVRAMALRGEWQILSAAGMSQNRKLAGLFAVAALAAGLVLADRFEWRPAGERALDATYLDLRAGKFGVPLPIGEAIPFDRNTILFASGVDHAGALTGAVVQRDDQVFFTAAARVTNSAGRVTADLSHGIGIVRRDDGSVQRMRFGALRFSGNPPMIGLVGDDFRHRLDRQSTEGLLRLAADSDPATADAALMALVMRIDSALFCLLIPWMGAVLGLPASRLHTAGGIAVAILLVVAHLKSAVFVEDQFGGHAIVAELVHASCWLGVVRGLFWLERRGGEGFVERALPRLLNLFRSPPRVPARARAWPAGLRRLNPAADYLPGWALGTTGLAERSRSDGR